MVKISNIISHFTKYRQDFLEKEVYTYLPDLRKLGIKDIDEIQFYKLIGLTQDEIKLFDKYYINIDEGLWGVSFNVGADQIDAMVKTMFELRIFKTEENKINIYN